VAEKGEALEGDKITLPTVVDFADTIKWGLAYMEQQGKEFTGNWLEWYGGFWIPFTGAMGNVVTVNRNVTIMPEAAAVIVDPTLVKFTRLVRFISTAAGYEEIQDQITGTAPNFTLVRKGGASISGVIATGKSVAVQIEGITTQKVYIAPVNNLGAEGAKILMTHVGGGIYEPSTWANFSWNGSLMTNLTYKLNFYADDNLIGSLAVTITP